MKIIHCLMLAALFLTQASCDRRETPKDKINDALDRRPAEGVRDTAEDIKDDIKDATD